MNGDRDMFHVARSEILRPTSSAYRKIVKGYSPAKLPVCASSLFSSSNSKGHTNSGRRLARSSISQALIQAANGERKRLVGGKTPTKGSAILAFPGRVEDDIVDEKLDTSQLKPNNSEGLEKTKGGSFSDDDLHKHVPEMLQQPSCNEKVSKWLEESQHSTMTDLSDCQTVSSDEEYEMIRRETRIMATQMSKVCDYQDRNRLAYIYQEINPTVGATVYVPVHQKFRAFSLKKLLIVYLKLIVCLSIVYMGLLSRIWPTSWDQYVPPPT